MDYAIDGPAPTPALPLDRRKVAALIVGGGLGLALSEGGVGMGITRRIFDGPTVALGSLNRTVSALASGYEMTSPKKTAVAVHGAERALVMALGDGMRAGSQMRDAKALYGQILVMSANTSADLGDHGDAIRAAQVASSMAIEVGDAETSGHAWAVISGSLLGQEKARAAVAAARRGAQFAGRTPAGVMSLLAEATAQADLGSVQSVYEAVTTAEAYHSKLGPEAWGQPGYSLRTYHRGYLLAFGSASMVRVGLVDEATPRLAEAAELLAGPNLDGINSYIYLNQARAAVAAGKIDEAHAYLSMAVARSELRPSEWLAGAVVKLNDQTRGAFADLEGQTSRWGFG